MAGMAGGRDGGGGEQKEAHTACARTSGTAPALWRARAAARALRSLSMKCSGISPYLVRICMFSLIRFSILNTILFIEFSSRLVTSTCEDMCGWMVGSRAPPDSHATRSRNAGSLTTQAQLLRLLDL